MSYHTIVVPVDLSADAGRRTETAIKLAEQYRAHLIGTAEIGFSTELAPAALEVGGPALGSAIDQLYANAHTALKRFTDSVAKTNVDSYETRLINDEFNAGLAVQARYADLVIVGQTDPARHSVLFAGTPENVAMQTPRPVLVLPQGQEYRHPGKEVMLAWDTRREAVAAVHAALPFLKTAQRVTVAVLNPGSASGGHGEEPGADLGTYLARHGVRVDIRVVDTDEASGAALCGMVAEQGADLLVMGCYGHARMREAIVGGTTRHVLRHMRTPVLMAH